MLKLDLQMVTYFLNKLDPNARHTIASEAPFGRNGLPKWMPGSTYESSQFNLLLQDIQDRQEHKENVYYSVNRPCPVYERQGFYGKNNIDDIYFIRALAFDIDTLENAETVLSMVKEKLDGELLPSLVISTGGGYHLIYLLDKLIDIRLYRPAKNEEQKRINEIYIKRRSEVTQLAKDFEHMLRGIFPTWKIDNMSNVDRVMRLPGTINYPKAEKVAKGQKEALSYIALNTGYKTDINKIRSIVPPLLQEKIKEKFPFKPPKDYDWTAYKKALACCEYIRDNHLADTNEWYTLHVMLPLIGAIHDENEQNRITIQEAEELFMMAISGGERYNTMGRGERYFNRQWRSHHPELKRSGTKSLGSLVWAAVENGFTIPWVSWMDEESQKIIKKAKDHPEKMLKEDYDKLFITQELLRLFRRIAYLP